jgi:RNA polymerase sigma-70 factor (ECF subfamily)
VTAAPEVHPDTADAGSADDWAVLAESRVDPDHFVTLFDRYYGEINRYAGSRLGTGVAEDVASETFLIAFRRRAAFDPGVGVGQVRSWLYGIATNLIHRHRRDEERRYRAMARIPDEPSDAGHDERVAVRLSAERIRGELATALAALPAGDRDVLLLTALGGLDHHEIAAALGIPYGTVCSRLNRVRRKVRAALGVDPTETD